MQARAADLAVRGIVSLAITLPGLIDQSPADPVVVTVPLADTRASSAEPPAVSVSADGRYVAFVSRAPLDHADTSDRTDIYVLDRLSSAVSLETPRFEPLVHGDVVGTPRISATGRFLVHQVMREWGGKMGQQLMLRDRVSGVTRAAYCTDAPPDGSSHDASISADGRFIAFASSATNIAEGPDANGSAEDIYVLDAASMSCRRVSLDASGHQPASGASFSPAISADGRYVAFTSTAQLGGPVPRAAERPSSNVYVRDTRLGVTTRVSVAADGGPPNGPSYQPAISDDGRYVAFVSDATNLVRSRDRNNTRDVYLRDTIADVTSLVSRNGKGGAANGPSDHPAMSSDGSAIVFQSEASDLTCGDRCRLADRDINLVTDVFLYDSLSGTTRRVSQGHAPWMESSIGPSVDGSGTVVAFSSMHPIDRSDDRHDYDLFVWARPPAAGAHAARLSAR